MRRILAAHPGLLPSAPFRTLPGDTVSTERRTSSGNPDLRRMLAVLWAIWGFMAIVFVALPARAGSPGMAYLNETGTSALIPSTVEELPDFAFEDCKDLREVVFETPSRCHKIGEYAFLGCSSLEEIHLPATLRTIGDGAFRECTALRHIEIPREVHEIPTNCFYGCSALEEAKLPDCLLDIKKLAFIYCESLRDVRLPSAIEHIGNNAFTLCISLTHVEIPDSVVELESYAFSDCLSLQTAKLPANNKLLGELIFSGCLSLREITELSPVPPIFDCDSYLFEPDDTERYADCRLHVAKGAEDLYRTAPGWRLFKNISDQ